MLKISAAKLARATQVNLSLLNLVNEDKEELKSLPSDLRERANEILYGVFAYDSFYTKQGLKLAEGLLD